jgi:cell wall-associated NlpC family hydrolase
MVPRELSGGRHPGRGAAGSRADRNALAADPPGWVADYIGLPWRERGRPRAGWRAARADEEVAGCDCWGLLRLVLAERFGIDVPAYDGRYADTSDRAELVALIRGGTGPWRAIWTSDAGGGVGGTAAAGIQAGDGVLFRLAGQPCHVGVVVAKGWMLHVQGGTDSGLERFDGVRWARRLAGFYRWVGETA